MQPAGRPPVSTGASGERAAAQAKRRQGMLLASPGALYLMIFFVAPLALISVYSFATRTSTGRTSLSGWNVESYRAIGDDVILGIIGRSAWLATLTTALCLAVGYPFAYYLATRPRHVRAILLVLVMIPFWTNGLVRVFAIRFLLGSNGPASALSENLGFGTFRILFTPTAVTIGMVYSFLTFMVLPLYVSLERMDWSLTEAARDLYASGSKAFWKVTLPLTKSGIVAGSVLVFVPSFGSYVVPDILGGAKTLLIGSYIARQFRDARNYPLGAALSVLLIAAMLVAVALNQRSGSGAEGGDRPRRRRRGGRSSRVRVRARARAGGESGAAIYDLVVPSDYMVDTMRREGLLLELNYDAIPNSANIDPAFTNPPFDPEHRYHVAYQWGTTGIGMTYEVLELLGGESTWAVLFDPDTAALVPGSISMLDDAPEAVSAALKYLGYSIEDVINNRNEDAIQEAGDLLRATNERLLKYDSVTFGDDLVNGEVDVAHGWSGGFALSIDEADAYETHVYTIPAEGGVRWVDTMAIPHNADNVCSAHAMINFLTDAENGATLTNWTFYGSPNAAATPFIDSAILEDPGIYPPPEVDARLEFIPHAGDMALLIQDQLTNAKS